MVELVEKPERAIAHLAAAALGHRGQRGAVDPHLAGGRHIEPAQQMQQRALARAGRADDRDPLAGRDGEIDALQHRHFERPAAVRLREAAALDDRREHHS